MVTVQSLGVDAYEVNVFARLGKAGAVAEVYRVWLCSPTDMFKVTVTTHHVPTNSPISDVRGEILCDETVEFYNEIVYVDCMSMGEAGRFTLPEGAGRYRVVVAADRELRRTMDRLSHEILASNDDLGVIGARFREHDGREWYDLYFQYLEPIPYDPDDDDDTWA